MAPHIAQTSKYALLIIILIFNWGPKIMKNTQIKPPVSSPFRFEDKQNNKNASNQTLKVQYTITPQKTNHHPGKHLQTKKNSSPTFLDINQTASKHK